MPKLSVITLTLNEEKNIIDSLESTRWADEVIVVDSCSTDETVKLAKKYTDNIFFFSSDEEHGGAALRNFALSKATGDWILFVDADERVSPELAAEIQAVVSADGPCDGYYLHRRNYIFGRLFHGRAYDRDFQLRLYPKSKGIYQSEEGHEAPSIKKVGYLKGKLWHYCQDEIAEYVDNMNRCTSWAATDMLREKQSTSIFEAFWMLILKPLFWFFYQYFVMGACRNGQEGFNHAVLGSYYQFVRYAKYWERVKIRGEATK